jgi:sugar lactone lactonase YvrE
MTTRPTRRAFTRSESRLLIADTNNHRIRRVGADGLIATIAGTGEAKSAGDGGPGTKAAIYSPESITLDSAGNLYIAEANGNRIRRVTPDGTIATIAGTGTASSTGDLGPASSATLNHPTDVRVDAGGNVVVAELYGNRIRRFQPGGKIEPVLGDGRGTQTGDGGRASQATAFYPGRLHIDGSGNIFFTENYNTGVRRIDIAGIVNRFAGLPDSSGFGGPARQVKLVDPRAIAVSPSGDVYIADGDGRRVHHISPGGTHSLLAGDGGYAQTAPGKDASKVSFQRPWGLALMPDGEVLIADMWQNRVLGVAASGAR